MTFPRLLLVTPWPPASVGGTQTLVRGLANALAKEFAVEVTVLTADVTRSEAAPGRSWSEVRRPWVSPPRRAGLPRVRQLVGDVYFADLDRVVDETNPTAILYTPHNSPCAHDAARAARERRIPLLLWPLIHLDQRRHVNSSARRLYRSADLVIATSEVERRWLLDDARVPPARILRLGCGHDGVADVTPARAVVPGGTLRLVTVGGYSPHKRVADQIEALAFLRRRCREDVRLTVAGLAGAGSVRESLRAFSRRLGVEECVSLLVDCTDEEIRTLLRASDVFLFTSASESLGVALFEAIAAGTFPVIYPHPVYRELVESSGLGTVARRATPRALARAVLVSPGVLPAGVEEQRSDWLSERSWKRTAAPIAERLQRFASDHTAELLRRPA